MAIHVKFMIKCNTAALAAFTKGMDRATAALAAAAKILQEQQEDLYRAAWWQRGEGPPELLARYEPEWWQHGEEPPPFGCAI